MKTLGATTGVLWLRMRRGEEAKRRRGEEAKPRGHLRTHAKEKAPLLRRF
ncbi:hypothetical protein LMG27174_05948 [Paraburkholderia rhynchosiae]|uniref:Uncharacterized protein n=1 Tax=Paraburkholderia rhynchosiae TaxID=487049 RepID=A0A6J5CCN5_9BURK|nr:hypothetical protein LMG27174_05948 [Paraburkholderia rhynchosiae]